MVWHGYVEERAISDVGRKKDGAALRLQRTPEAVLNTPEDVSDWINRKAVEVAKGADQAASAKNALMVQHGPAYRGVASKGGSAYATVHVSRTDVVDICAEITEVVDGGPAAGR